MLHLVVSAIFAVLFLAFVVIAAESIVMAFLSVALPSPAVIPSALSCVETNAHMMLGSGRSQLMYH
jgi:uncharacterized integral membrane protein